MRLSYQLRKLLGTIYSSPQSDTTPNILFNSNSDTLYSPTSNRIQVIDLTNNTVSTLPFESRSNISKIALSKNDTLLIIIDSMNHCMIVHLHKKVLICRLKFRDIVHDISFSPNDQYFVITSNKTIQIWNYPQVLKYNPCILHNTLGGCSGLIKCISWSHDSSIIMGGCVDGTVRMWTCEKIYKSYVPVCLSGHRRGIIGCYMDKKNNGRRLGRIYSVSVDGCMLTWVYKRVECVKEEEENEEFDEEYETQAHELVYSDCKYVHKSRYYFKQQHDISCTNHITSQNILVVGFNHGTFGLYELPSVHCIHTLSVGNERIGTVCLNHTGEWIALASPSNCQLTIWEWRSESYIIQQKGHYYGMNCMSYSQDGIVIVTGNDDGSVQLWNSQSGFCYCTFNNHTANVTSVCFVKNSVVASSSLDGTVRVYDLYKYRNFKTYRADKAGVPFISLACDASGDILVAGTTDPFYIYTWSFQTGKLLDVLTGHVGPVSSVTFDPRKGTLASGSWDGTVKLWDLYQSTTKQVEPAENFRHLHDVVCLAWRPDSLQLCTGTVGALLSFWNISDGKLLYEIDGKHDIVGGRGKKDLIASINKAASKYFTSICYSADGLCLLAGGNSKYVCLYECEQKLLIKKFQISYNRSVDGVLDELNSRYLGEGGILEEERDGNDLQNGNLRLSTSGYKHVQKKRRNFEVKTKQLAFSNTGREWAAITHEGLHIYSLDKQYTFDPIALKEGITTVSMYENLNKKNYAVALSMALHLNEKELVLNTMEKIPYASIVHVVKTIHPSMLEKLLHYLAQFMNDSPHVEFYIQWCLELLMYHGTHMEKNRSEYLRGFRSMYSSVVSKYRELNKEGSKNKFMLEFVESQARLKNEKLTNEASIDTKKLKVNKNDENKKKSLVLDSNFDEYEDRSLVSDQRNLEDKDDESKFSSKNIDKNIVSDEGMSSFDYESKKMLITTENKTINLVKT